MFSSLVTQQDQIRDKMNILSVFSHADTKYDGYNIINATLFTILWVCIIASWEQLTLKLTIIDRGEIVFLS